METIGTVELVELTGATYRQIDSWTRRGLISPLPRPIEDSGYRRRYPHEAIGIVRALVRWSAIAHGERHTRIVEAIATGGNKPVPLAPGFYVIPAEVVAA